MVEHVFDELSGPGPSAGTASLAGPVETAVEVVFGWLDSLDARARLAASERLRRRLDAGDARALAANVVGDPYARGAARRAYALARGCGVSRIEQRRRVNRARAIAENDQIAERLAAGMIGADHVDAIAAAARRSSGAAARDPALLDELTSVSADQARSVADRWVNGRLSPDDVETEHHRQRRLRGARKTTTADGLASITLAGDLASIDVAWRTIEAAADRLYRVDGGRDLPHGRHPRSASQRRFDAAVAAITGSPAGNGPSRPTIVITASVDTFAGVAGAPPAQLVGAGPIAATLLERYRCHADLVGLVCDRDGQPLWHGRSIRTATPAQRSALVARDRGCVLCGAHHGSCEVHHIIPYLAPDRGPTDIDNLALLCGPCHIGIHERNHTLTRGPTGHWTTRPATPQETPPARRPTRARAPGVDPPPPTSTGPPQQCAPRFAAAHP